MIVDIAKARARYTRQCRRDERDRRRMMYAISMSIHVEAPPDRIGWVWRKFAMLMLLISPAFVTIVSIRLTEWLGSLSRRT